MAGSRTDAAAAEVAALRRPFIVGAVVILAAMAALGFVIRAANAGNDRPEGAAERWLAAVGDTTRKGIGDDARKRTEEIGPLAAAAPLVAGARTEGKAAFPDLEVGGARLEEAIYHAPDTLDLAGAATRTARVPYRLHVRQGGGEVLKEGVVLLERRDGWRVTGLDAARSGEKVPSEGGPVPSRAPLGAFVGAIVVGVLVALGCAGLIRWSGPRDPVPS